MAEFLGLYDFLKKDKIFVMLVGFPGSGKSTWAMRTFPTYIGQSWRYVSSDAYIEGMAKDAGKTYNEVFRQHIDRAQSSCEYVAIQGFKRGHDIVWDQTNLTRSTRARKLRIVPDTYKKYCIEIQCTDPVKLNERLQSREGKTIPDFVLETMRQNYQEPALDEGFDKIWQILT